MFFPLNREEEKPENPKEHEKQENRDEKSANSGSETILDDSCKNIEVSLLYRSWWSTGLSVLAALCLLISCLITYFFIKGLSDWIGNSSLFRFFILDLFHCYFS
jgi:hypothetical protein